MAKRRYSRNGSPGTGGLIIVAVTLAMLAVFVSADSLPEPTPTTRIVLLDDPNAVELGLDAGEDTLSHP